MHNETATVPQVSSPPLLFGVNPEESERVVCLLQGILNW